MKEFISLAVAVCAIALVFLASETPHRPDPMVGDFAELAAALT